MDDWMYLTCNVMRSMSIALCSLAGYRVLSAKCLTTNRRGNVNAEVWAEMKKTETMKRDLWYSAHICHYICRFFVPICRSIQPTTITFWAVILQNLRNRDGRQWNMNKWLTDWLRERFLPLCSCGDTEHLVSSTVTILWILFDVGKIFIVVDCGSLHSPTRWNRPWRGNALLAAVCRSVGRSVGPWKDKKSVLHQRTGEERSELLFEGAFSHRRTTTHSFLGLWMSCF